MVHLKSSGKDWQLAAIPKSGGFLINYDMIVHNNWGAIVKYTPLYEKPWKKTKNALVETTFFVFISLCLSIYPISQKGKSLKFEIKYLDISS